MAEDITRKVVTTLATTAIVNPGAFAPAAAAVSAKFNPQQMAPQGNFQYAKNTGERHWEYASAKSESMPWKFAEANEGNSDYDCGAAHKDNCYSGNERSGNDYLRREIERKDKIIRSTGEAIVQAYTGDMEGAFQSGADAAQTWWEGVVELFGGKK
jgi:hypothetical protein